MTASTFPVLLQQQLRGAAARPLVTFYDDATGERVELSVTTYANWVAKTAGLLQDELELGPGARLLVDLPTHWLGPVWLGAAWHVGATVVPGSGQDADLVVCGPDDVETYAAGGPDVVACSLLPMGVRFRDPLPAGVLDFGVVVWGQPDSFAALDPVRPDHVAWADGADVLRQDQLAVVSGVGGRVLTDANPLSREGLEAFLGPLASGGGTVWVRKPAAGSWEARASAEQATVLPAQPRS